MIIKRCKCGAIPKIYRGENGPVFLLQLQCRCGDKGALLMFTKPEDEARMRQAAIDGWNLAD